MKKFFFIAVGVIGLMLTACTSEDEATPGSLLEQNITQFGTKSSTIDVYAGAKKMTRGIDVNGNMWPSLPAYPTDEEIAGVLKYVAENPGANVPYPGWTCYYVQHVGGAHHQYSYVDWNGASHTGIDGTASMEYLRVVENDGTLQHVYNFNAGKCDNAATHNSVLMTNGFKGAFTLNEYSSSEIDAWRIYEYNGAYYLAFDFKMKKDDGKIDADGIFDDWIVKLIPGAGEGDPDPEDPAVDPEDPTKRIPEVEFDVHQQEHGTWKEIKTSIHLRDTVNTRIFIPIPQEYQAAADDFDIRNGADYFYIENVTETKFEIASKEYTVDVRINHTATGIEILLGGAELAEALKVARGVYDDGLTFEIHSYVFPTATDEQVWSWLKQIECLQTSMNKWPQSGECITHTYGQVTSAFYEDANHFDKNPQ